jgi:HlyD family secretion protein
MVLRAPRAGIAVAAENRREGRKFQVGDSTWDGAEIMLIPDLSVMVVETLMSDVDDGKVTPGMRVLCTLDAYPERQIPGHVRTVTPVAQWLNMRSEQRFFRIIVDLQETDAEIMRPGMSVKVEVVTAVRDDELLVPRAALEFGDQDVFAVLENGERRQIELGLCSAHECIVASGLAEGTRVRVRQ